MTAMRSRTSTISAQGRDGFSPIRVLDVEITEPLPLIGYDENRQRAFVVARLHSQPVGVRTFDVGREGLAPNRLGELLWPEICETVRARFSEARLPGPDALPGGGLEVESAEWPSARCRSEVLAAPPLISVVICTRDRAQLLEGCLRQVVRLDYPNFEIIVVDNAPTNDVVRTLVETRLAGMAYRYAVESRGGLSWARNAGTAAARGEIIAFLDDDAKPDRHWLTGIACGFARSNDIGCVTGIILPARLDTQAQVLFEQLGGHSKGRGFSPAIFSPQGPQSPLYPRPAFGAGANMAFRREALRRIGGFDVALGAGTPSFAGEDTLAMTLTLLSGYCIAYEPAALVRHEHRRDFDGLSRQLHGYDVGLTAYYAALLRHRPTALAGLLRLIPSAAGCLRKREQTGTAVPPEFQESITRRQLAGVLTGPAAYARSSIRQARMVPATFSTAKVPQ
jgi:O-antigen biosynthesis protein